MVTGPDGTSVTMKTPWESVVVSKTYGRRKLYADPIETRQLGVDRSNLNVAIERCFRLFLGLQPLLTRRFDTVLERHADRYRAEVSDENRVSVVDCLACVSDIFTSCGTRGDGESAHEKD